MRQSKNLCKTLEFLTPVKFNGGICQIFTLSGFTTSISGLSTATIFSGQENYKISGHFQDIKTMLSS